MARIEIDDLEKDEEISQEEMESIMGGGFFSTFENAWNTFKDESAEVVRDTARYIHEKT